MKEFNLKKLIQSSMFYNSFSLNEIDGIYDYLLEIDVDLNTINIDDFLVNGSYRISEEEYNDMSREEKDDIVLFAKDGNSLLVSN